MAMRVVEGRNRSFPDPPLLLGSYDAQFADCAMGAAIEVWMGPLAPEQRPPAYVAAEIHPGRSSPDGLGAHE
jgi:hypothetical protein